MAGTITVFTVEGFPEHLMFTTPENFSRVLTDNEINPDKVKFQVITFESIELLLRGVIQYKAVELSNEIR